MIWVSCRLSVLYFSFRNSLLFVHHLRMCWYVFRRWVSFHINYSPPAVEVWFCEISPMLISLSKQLKGVLRILIRVGQKTQKSSSKIIVLTPKIYLPRVDLYSRTNNLECLIEGQKVFWEDKNSSNNIFENRKVFFPILQSLLMETQMVFFKENL